MKTITTNTDRVQLQRQLEQSQSINTIDALIRTEVESTDLTIFINAWCEYMANFMNISDDNKHKQFHHDLLEQVDPVKGIKTLLRAIIKASVTTNSYIDRNVIAWQVGRKLLPKQYKTGTAYNRAMVTESLGLNLINLAAYMKMHSYKMIHGANNRTISTIVPHTALIMPHIVEAYKSVRANSIMITEPKPHTSTKQGGNLTNGRTMLNSSGFNSISTQSDRANEAINQLQSVQYNIRTNLTNEILLQYKLHDKWYDANGVFMANEWNKLLADIQLVQDNPGFYFAMSYDDRGRIYDLSAYIKIQGDKYQKSMLEFANKEVCTDEGLSYLAVAIVNELYNDKISFDDAVDWFNSQSIPSLQAIADEQSNPIATLLILDYIDAINGKPVGVITQWDATNSGLQFYSILAMDRATASLCNIFDTGSIADAYKALADKLNELTDTTNFNRSNVKKAFMTFLYGSMANNILYNLNDPKNGVTAGIAEFFPSDMDHKAMWDTFTFAMDSIAPAAIRLMNLIYTYNSNGRTKFKWTMPDGFEVECTTVVSYMEDNDEADSKSNTKITGYYMDMSGNTHSGDISVKLEQFNAMSRALAPNIIHAIDSYFAREVIRNCDFDISFIHDSFGCHPNNTAKLMEVIRETMARISTQDLLYTILSQIDPSQAAYHKRKGYLDKGELTADDILASNYIIR